MHCFERESTFKDAAKSQTSSKFIALAMSQRCDYFKSILVQSNDNFTLVMCSAILNFQTKKLIWSPFVIDDVSLYIVSD